VAYDVVPQVVQTDNEVAPIVDDAFPAGQSVVIDQC
jgi:hypothetical protein